MKWQMRFLNCKIESVKLVYRTGTLFKNLKDILEPLVFMKDLS